ncbi:metallophosphoesterase [Rhizocola hellebori]|uniref:Metallophosphoesterase n=1 Tax=Rhizocola hellebori TaxID=1392758 RepID=A0A8J3VH88_9ACTN|nr:metallophosphoesterase [Rhizocola hellebori]GIH05668.1 metallophosphoesterase [Rhizocola hellebori]
MFDLPSLLAISDLHVGFARNRELVQELRPRHEGDWLLVAGDVADHAEQIVWALGLLASRFAKVIWAPGNHELWTRADDPVQLRGVARYEHLVGLLREVGVVTPEDPYPVWPGADGEVAVAALFVGYDYSFRVPQVHTKEEALELAYERGTVCTDEVLLHPDPYPSREAWCDARLAYTQARLEARSGCLPTILVNHYPLVREPTLVLRHPEFAIWCGTERTADWHLRFNAAAVVYGHLHIPRSTVYDGVPFEEVSVGYPREWQPRGPAPQPRVIATTTR